MFSAGAELLTGLRGCWGGSGSPPPPPRTYVKCAVCKQACFRGRRLRLPSFPEELRHLPGSFSGLCPPVRGSRRIISALHKSEQEPGRGTHARSPHGVPLPPQRSSHSLVAVSPPANTSFRNGGPPILSPWGLVSRSSERRGGGGGPGRVVPPRESPSPRKKAWMQTVLPGTEVLGK